LGLELLAKGEADMAAASRLPADLPTRWVATPIAWDGLAIIVHPDNPLEELTLFQLRHVFAGWVSRWQDVGAPVAEEEDVLTIQVLSREDGSGTRAVFEQQVMGDERVTFAALVMPGSQAVVDYVADHPNTIGYVSMALTDSHVKALRIEGLAPTPATVRSGYHLARPFYLVTRGRPTGRSQAFIDFVLGPAGQAIVGEKYGRVR
jgi:phosphate transport system substrate-binding protein